MTGHALYAGHPKVTLIKNNLINPKGPSIFWRGFFNNKKNEFQKNKEKYLRNISNKKIP